MSCLNASNSTGDESSSVETEPFVLFGSNFPKDSEYAQVYYLKCIHFQVWPKASLI